LFRQLLLLYIIGIAVVIIRVSGERGEEEEEGTTTKENKRWRGGRVRPDH
jgi:hypothetical protein